MEAVEKQRPIHPTDGLNDDTELPRHNPVRQSEYRITPDKKRYVESWLDESSRSRVTPTQTETRFLEVFDDTPSKSTVGFSSNSSGTPPSASSETKSSGMSARDSKYRKALGYRNIYIEREDPPVEIMRRAHMIISHQRESPEIDDVTTQKVKDVSLRLQNRAEDVILMLLAPYVIPAISDQRLEQSLNQVWYNSVPLPLKPSIRHNPPRLRKPKPDLAFGYSEAAFTDNQLGMINLLIADKTGWSYATPDEILLFPFLSIEFKSQAQNGTHYVATNQVAGTGAIALNGIVELMKRSFGMEKFDYDEPHFFSVTVDHQLACVNVHWLRALRGGEQHSFHVESLSEHLLKDANGVKALIRALKNILDHGAGTRLQTLCGALDAYHETILQDEEAANSRRKQRSDVRPQPRQKRPREEDGLAVEKAPTGRTRRCPGLARDSTLRPQSSKVTTRHARAVKGKVAQVPPSGVPSGPRTRGRKRNIRGRSGPAAT